MQAVLDTIAALDRADERLVRISALPDAIMCVPAAVVLRVHLAPVDRVALCLRVAASRAAEASSLLRETALYVGHLDIGSDARKNFWNNAYRYAEVDGFLWDVAPKTIRQLVLSLQPGVRPKEPEVPLSAFSPPKALEVVDWNARLASEPVDRLVAEAITLVKQMRPNTRGRYANRLPLKMLHHKDAGDLRRLLEGDVGVTTYLALLSQQDLSQSLLNEFTAYSNRLGPDQEADMWSLALQQSPHFGLLSSQVPVQVRRKLISRQNAPFIVALKGVAPFPVTTIEAADPARLYAGLDELDFNLAGSWAGKNATEFATAMMLSARGAEKAAANFYRRLGSHVEDTSIQQLQAVSNGDWKTHDLIVDSSKPIDVKNARTSVNSRGGYSEHHVPSFKHDRNGRSVTIVGVRSPYLKLDEMKGERAIPFRRVISILVLGECTRAELQDLRAEFTSDLLEDISFRRAGRGHGEGSEFLPPWVFSYPAAFYEQDVVRQYRAQIAEVGRHEPPGNADCELLGINPLPFLLQISDALPSGWQQSLQMWQANLISQLRSAAKSSSLPRLFLTLLRDFLKAVAEDRPKFSPRRYRTLVFPCLEDDRFNGWRHVPLGIFDPLESIDSLIATLELLWDNRATVGLSGFKAFRFGAVGILRGKRRAEDDAVTLIAYCGGLTEVKAPCGNSPLVLGIHNPCPVCGHLICDKCGFCQWGCSAAESRQQSGGSD